MLVWAVAEALVWPIIPDVLLGLLVIARPHRGPKTLTAAIVGSAAAFLLRWWLG